MRSNEEILQMKLEARDLEIVALKDALFMRNKKSVLKTSRHSSGSFRVVANDFGLGLVK